MKYLSLLILTNSLIPAHSALAQDVFTVTLAKVNANRTAFGDAGDKLRLICDDKVPLDESRTNIDGQDYWEFEPKQTRRVDLICLTGKPLDSSFVLRLEAEHENNNIHIGTLKATLVREDNEVKLTFEQKKEKRIYRARRKTRIDGETFWVTRVFPGKRSANYILHFKIDAASRPSAVGNSK